MFSFYFIVVLGRVLEDANTVGFRDIDKIVCAKNEKNLLNFNRFGPSVITVKEA